MFASRLLPGEPTTARTRCLGSPLSGQRVRAKGHVRASSGLTRGRSAGSRPLLRHASRAGGLRRRQSAGEASEEEQSDRCSQKAAWIEGAG